MSDVLRRPTGRVAAVLSSALLAAGAPGCRGPEDGGNDLQKIDLTERYTPGGTAGDAPADSGPSPWSDRIDGRTYAIDLASAERSTPDGFIDLIAGEFGIAPLVMVTGSSASSIELLAALAEPGTGRQHPCLPTDALTGTFASAPAFSVSAPAGHTALPAWSDAVLRTEEVVLEGSVSEDGERLLELAYSARVDLREGTDVWIELIGVDDPYAVCDLMGSLGARCEACADGTPTCLWLGFDGAVAPAVDVPLAPVADGDCL